MSINPPDVYFNDKLDAEGRSNGSIDLFNRSNQSMIFKVKTTDPTKFIVKPNVGQLAPESSAKIQIFFVGSTSSVREIFNKVGYRTLRR